MIPDMYKVIVVGTDGSETAGVAVDQATALAELSGATLHIVHGHQPLPVGRGAAAASSGRTGVGIDSANAGIASDSRSICEQAAAKAKSVGVAVETHARPGDPATELVKVAEEVGADLLVIGNRGMSGARRFISGSVPNKVSHHCPCSLLIVDTAAA
jgi:nucleotide-binding universal stress UspA family protein